jgi:hypothetical protein
MCVLINNALSRQQLIMKGNENWRISRIKLLRCGFKFFCQIQNENIFHLTEIMWANDDTYPDCNFVVGFSCMLQIFLCAYAAVSRIISLQHSRNERVELKVKTTFSLLLIRIGQFKFEIPWTKPEKLERENEIWKFSSILAKWIY